MPIKTVIVIGDDGSLRDCTIRAFGAQGCKVAVRGADCTAADILSLRAEVQGDLRVVFTPYEHDEFALLTEGADRLVDHVGARTKAFLAQAQAALQLLMEAGGGQFWVADFDDSFAYHLDSPCAPIAAQARAGAVRSIAKEYSRMKIAVNSMLVQPVQDDGNAAMFREAAAGLKSFAMRYKPTPAVDVADMLAGFVRQDRLSFSGSMVGTGTGISQAHLTL